MTGPQKQVLVTLAFAFTAAACQRHAAAPSTDAPAAPAFVWSSAAPRAVDPAAVGDTTGASLALNLFEGLLVAPPQDGEPLPGVAERFEVSADGRTYAFHLRANARWSDGQPVTADDFVYAWRRMLAPATAAPGAEDLWVLLNGRAYNEGHEPRAEQVGVRALEPQLLLVTLESPDPLFPHALATSRFLPAPRWAVEAHGAQWTRPENIVCNGAYTLAEWAPNERLVLRRNARYWDAEHVALAAAELRVTESEATALRWYEAGEVHYTPGQVPFEALVRFQEEGRADLRLDPFAGVFYLAFNVRRAPFDDARVRAAFDRAVDKAALIRATLRGGQLPATHLVPELYATVAGYHGPRGPGYDPAAARDLLAAAGFPGGAGFPPVRLLYNTSDVMARIVTFVADDWQRNLGLVVTPEQREWQSYLARVQQGDFDVARFGIQGGVVPSEFLSVLRSGGPNNIGGYVNPAFDAALERLRAKPDREARLQATAAAEQMLIDDAAVAPLYFYTRPALLSPKVHGFAAESQDLHLLKYLSLSP